MGDIFRKSKFDQIKSEVNQAGTRWKKAHVTTNVSSGTPVYASHINQFIAKLNECKKASGWTGSVTPAQSAGSVISDISGALINQAVAIRLHCPCHGNCTGSCRTSCTGGCEGSCHSSCGDSCGSGCRAGCTGHTGR